MNRPSLARYAMSAALLSTALLSTTLLSTTLMTGCSFSASSRSSSSSGDDDKTVVQQAPNYPEQLLQLNEAHEKKLISDEDYQKQLKKIQKAMNK
jgi:hypothetical protein